MSEKVVESTETIACFTTSAKQGMIEIEVINLNQHQTSYPRFERFKKFGIVGTK